MRINNNIMALNTHRQYAVNNASVANSTEKLSSGYRINRAGDDAAGLAISEKMRAQIRGLEMASKNSQDAISLVQTAEGALTETHAILQRMRELAVQSASDTNEEGVDRSALDAEFQQLKTEINDIAGKTAFNNKNLLDGSFSTTVAFDSSSSIEVDDDVTAILVEGFAASEDTYTVTFGEVTDTGDPYEVTLSGAGTGTATANQPTGAGSLVLNFGDGRTVTLSLDDHDADAFSEGTLTFTVSGGGAIIQTGANAGDTLSINIGSMEASALGITDDSSVTTQQSASSAISIVDTAINRVSSQRASLGAIQNRLQHKINNLNTSSENLQAAESRIRDLDMAKEMTAFTRNNILVQASTAMLAQANAAPQSVLSLLQ